MEMTRTDGGMATTERARAVPLVGVVDDEPEIRDRRDPELAPIPVIVVTAATDPHVEGAAVLLRKPFDLDALLMAATRLCGGPEQLDPPSV
jgi:CheY-like chemotaxis protein